MQQSFRNTSEDHTNSRLAYITHEDLCSSFEGDTLLAMRAPPQTHLEVPIPEEDPVTQVWIQIYLKNWLYHNYFYNYFVFAFTEETISDPLEISDSPHSCAVSE